MHGGLTLHPCTSSSVRSDGVSFWLPSRSVIKIGNCFSASLVRDCFQWHEFTECCNDDVFKLVSKTVSRLDVAEAKNKLDEGS